MHLQEKHYLTFDLDLGVKVTRNIAQYPLQHVTCLGKKFEVAPLNGLDGYIFTRNVMHGHTDGRTFRRTMNKLCCEINVPFFFLKKRVGIIRVKCFRPT